MSFRTQAMTTTSRHVTEELRPFDPGDGSRLEWAVALASAARRRGRHDDLDRLADYMGYCPHRREGHMRCGTRDGRTLSRRRHLDPRLLVVSSRRAHYRTMGRPQWGESGAWRPAFRAEQNQAAGPLR